MGWFIFILIVAIIIVSVVLVKKNKEDEAIEKLKTMAGYSVALKIKEKLADNGFNIGDLSTFMGDYGAVGSFYVSTGSYSDSTHKSVGTISVSTYESDLKFHYVSKPLTNYEGKKIVFYHLYDNNVNNINLFISSSENTNDVPQFIKIAAEVITNCGYQFSIQKV